MVRRRFLYQSGYVLRLQLRNFTYLSAQLLAKNYPYLVTLPEVKSRTGTTVIGELNSLPSVGVDVYVGRSEEIQGTANVSENIIDGKITCWGTTETIEIARKMAAQVLIGTHRSRGKSRYKWAQNS